MKNITVNDRGYHPVTAHVRLTLHTDEKFFGPGVCELLEHIAETGSIQAAAARMEMSYTKAWKILNRAEKQMGVVLTDRVNGGKNGGSSTLTAEGIRAVQDFRKMEESLTDMARQLFKEYGEVFLKAGTAEGGEDR